MTTDQEGEETSNCIELQLCHPLNSAVFIYWTIENLSAVQSWHQACTGASPASLTVPWEQLGRISVSVAAYKGLMEARALERRSY